MAQILSVDTSEVRAFCLLRHKEISDEKTITCLTGNTEEPAENVKILAAAILNLENLAGLLSSTTLEQLNTDLTLRCKIAALTLDEIQDISKLLSTAKKYGVSFAKPGELQDLWQPVQGVQDMLARIKVKCLEKYIAERSYINPTEEKKMEQAEYLTCFGRYSKTKKIQVTAKVIQELNDNNTITARNSRDMAILRDGKLGTLLTDLEVIDMPQPTGICAWFSQFCGSRPKPVDTTVQSKKNPGACEILSTVASLFSFRI